MSAERTPRGGFRLHLLLLLVLLVEVALAFARHRSDEELERLWERGDPRERLAALHVLTNRGEPHPSRFGQDFVRRLLAEEPPIFEAAFANEICKFEPPAIQNEVITDIPLESAGSTPTSSASVTRSERRTSTGAF